MHGLKVGHFSDPARGTGVSVFLFEPSAVGAYWICGSAPASHELAALDPDNSVPRCHGLVLAGGSAFGLHAAGGAMQFLRERGVGHPVPHGVVPIVPAAAIYDMAYLTDHYPGAADAYQACLQAVANDTQRGRIGAGTGATVGKLIPQALCMSGGLGRAVLTQADGLSVIVYVVVNAVGDVRDQGEIIAGACDQHGQLLNCEQFLLSGRASQDIFSGSNTTLAAVFTNASLDKSAAKRIAKMAVAGLARTLVPAFTCFDGDTVFCMSLGEHQAAELTIGAMAAEAVRLAVIDAVRDSVIIKSAS
jgi:L-aminopeptidase/D-esterase-like protein